MTKETPTVKTPLKLPQRQQKPSNQKARRETKSKRKPHSVSRLKKKPVIRLQTLRRPPRRRLVAPFLRRPGDKGNISFTSNFRCAARAWGKKARAEQTSPPATVVFCGTPLNNCQLRGARVFCASRKDAEIAGLFSLARARSERARVNLGYALCNKSRVMRQTEIYRF